MRDRNSMFSLLRPVLSAAACAVLLAGCSMDSLLKAKDPDVATPGSLAGADKLNTWLLAAKGDFQVGVSGTGNGSEGLVNFIGLFTDEFEFTETFPTRIVIDQRNLDPVNTTLRPIFFNISRARASAERAADAFTEFDPGSAGHAEALALAGYAQVFMAETYCSGVPFSRLAPDGSLMRGTPLTTQQMLEASVAKFDSAITFATAKSDAKLVAFASIGKARALMDLGKSNLPAAAAAVASVPASFSYAILHSANTSRENNGVWELVWNEKRWSVAEKEGTNGMPFRSAKDPRLPYDSLGKGFAANTIVWAPTIYGDRSASTIIASGTEAQLIKAEAQLAAGDPAWLTTLNDLRTGSGLGLTALADPGTPTAREDLLFRERAFWLYATGHRLGDMRRLSRAAASGGYGRNPETVFPTGTYIYQGQPYGTYGKDVNFPIPFEEGNNPEFSACLDRNP